MAHFRCTAETRAGQYVPSTFEGLISEAEEKINKGEILRPLMRLDEYGRLKLKYQTVLLLKFFIVIRYRGGGHVRILARYCLDYYLNGQPCSSQNYRLINECQAAHYTEHVIEGNRVENEDSQSVPNRPRASSLELLETRIKTVQEDPSHILNKRMKFSGRQFEFLGKFSFIYE